MPNQSPPEVTQDHECAPLTSVITIKISQPHWANLQTQALIKKCGHTTLARHWMLLGAAAEGIDLNAVF